MSGARDPAIEHLVRLAAGHPHLRLLVLFGSRARGDMLASSDWDLGYLADSDFDPLALLSELGQALRTDRIDLVDLALVGGQLRFRVAAEGQPIYASHEGVFPQFQQEAVRFWCDAGPIIEAGYRDLLARLGK
jgi:predicted nucleotidyltransferase